MATDPKKPEVQAKEPEVEPKASDTVSSLEELKAKVETQEMKEEEREALLVQILEQSLSEEIKSRLDQVTEAKDLEPSDREILKGVTAQVLALYWYKGEKINSVTDLISLARADGNDSMKYFSSVLIQLVQNDQSAAGKAFQGEIWEEAKGNGQTLLARIHKIEAFYQEEAEKELQAQKEKEEKGKESDSWYENHKSEINTALVLGAAGVGIWWLSKKLFAQADPNKEVSPVAKVGLVTVAGAMGVGQLLGLESVQELISGGKSDSWVYKPWAKGWIAAADLELGAAVDYWSGNGPTEAQLIMFNEMGDLFETSETRLWAASKMSFDDFMKGERSSILPWYQDDDDRIRTKIKDFYLTKLEKKLPYLKDEDQRKTVTLRQVLMDGYKLGVIKEVDLTALKPEDRDELTERSEEEDVKEKEEANLFGSPEEKTDELIDLSEEMEGDLKNLDAATDQYWDEALVAFENLIGVDFDLGEDDPEEYRDLNLAREKLYAFFEGAGKVDHEFFADKQERVKAFRAFLKRHQNDPEWTEGTKSEFEDYKTEMLELKNRIRSAQSRAEVANLQRMERERSPGEIVEDAATFADKFAFEGLSGAFHYLEWHLEQLFEGDKMVWGLTLATALGAGNELMRGSLKTQGWKSGLVNIVRGGTWIGSTPAIHKYKIAINGYHIYRAYRYSPNELLLKGLHGELSQAELKTRMRYAEQFGDSYKSRWIRITPNRSSAAELRLDQYKLLQDNLHSITRSGAPTELQDFIDGKLTRDQLSTDELRRFLFDMELTDQQIKEARFYRAFRAIQNSSHSAEILAHIKNPASPLSPQAKAIFDNLNDLQKETLRDLIDTKEGRRIMGIQVVEVDYTPKHLGEKTDATGAKVHRYQFGAEEYSLKEADIGARAGQIAIDERMAGRGPVPGEETAWDQANWNRAIRGLCEERFATPVRIAPGHYRFAGQEFKVDATELSRRMAGGASETEAAKSLCVEQGTAHLMVEEVRVRGGVYEYKMGKEWIRTQNPTTPAKLAEIRIAFETEMAKQGRSFDFAKFAAEAKTLQFMEAFTKIVGVPAAVMIIYHLETAEDKRTAVAEVTAGLLAFTAGYKTAKTMDQRLAKYIKDPRYRFALDVGAGALAALGFTDKITPLVEEYLFKKIPASHGVSKEASDILEKSSSRFIARTTLQSAEKGIIKKSVGKMGLVTFERAFEKRISGAFMQKIGKLAARQGFKQVLKTLGWKGVTTAALLADDATLIGVVDDIIALGLIVWMGFDIYEIVTLIANAVEVQKQMDERKKHPVKEINILDVEARKRVQEALLPFGLGVDQLYTLPEEQVFDILRTISSVRVEFVRENTYGSEIYSLVNGEARGISIRTEPYPRGEVECEITDEDAAEMEEALSQMEAVEEGDHAANQTVVPSASVAGGGLFKKAA